MTYNSDPARLVRATIDLFGPEYFSTLDELVGSDIIFDEEGESLINYTAMAAYAANQSQASQVTRLKNYFERNSVYTYQDLMEFTRDQSERHLSKEAGIRDPYVTAAIGPYTLRLLWTHLSSKSMNPFDTPFTEKETAANPPEPTLLSA